MTDRVAELVALGDLDALVVEVDDLCGRGEWDEVVRLRDRCDRAVEDGRQLWGVAQYAEYRLALDAPGRYAAAACSQGSSRFTLGPLTEVAASTHTWAELVDGLDQPWIAAAVAQERVLRGEDLRDDPRTHADDHGLPMVLQPWEPDYPLPVYRASDLHEGGPRPLPREPEAVAASPAPPHRHDELERALQQLAAEWAERSNGGCHVAVVRGDAAGAVAALLAEDARLVEVDAGPALERLAWTAASGGAYGRRRGMAAGRADALWVVAAACGLGFPPDPEAVGARLEQLRWYVIGGGHRAATREAEGEGDWSLRLAVEHSSEGWAAAVDAWDRREVD